MKSILIVEDDATLLRGLTDNFSSRGFEVHAAQDGQEACDFIQLGRPDILLLDVMLPGINGFEICQFVRRTDRETPIIMLTAKDREDDVVRGLQLGADDYISKPFSIRELVARVDALLRRSGVDDTIVHIGELELDLDAHILRRDGEEVPLTSKEFGLLKMFVQRPNRALTRSEILNHVWSNSVIVTTRSVDRCVLTLRSKIEADPAKPTLIKTVRDIGYRFERL